MNDSENEKIFQEQLLSKNPDIDRPEIAVSYVHWLIDQNRFKNAELILFTALSEGPRFDLYELRAYGTMIDLEELWNKIHLLQNKPKNKQSGTIYNEGLHKPDPDWASIISTINLNHF